MEKGCALVAGSMKVESFQRLLCYQVFSTRKCSPEMGRGLPEFSPPDRSQARNSDLPGWSGHKVNMRFTATSKWQWLSPGGHGMGAPQAAWHSASFQRLPRFLGLGKRSHLPTEESDAQRLSG